MSEILPQFKARRLSDGSEVTGCLFYWVRYGKRIPMIGDGVQNGAVMGFKIDPATIRPADDPRKNILDEAKYKIEHLEAGPPVELYRKGYYSAVIEALQILDEMEAKL